MTDPIIPKSYSELFPGRFLSAADLDGKHVTLTIAGVKRDRIEGEKGVEEKPIITFKETTRELVLARTNGECLVGMFGRSVAAWTGRRVILWPTLTRLGAQGEVPCVRVWGSPELERDLQVTVKLPKKKAMTMVMRKDKPTPVEVKP